MAGVRNSYGIGISKQVRDFGNGLGMSHRRALKLALAGLASESGDIKALGDELAGYHRLRVGPLRVIFRYASGRVIECVYANRRGLVYDVFEREVIERLK